MTSYTIHLTFSGNNIKTVTKKIKEFFGDDAAVMVEKRTNPTSRATRLDEAAGMLEDVKMIVTELKDEMQDWYDSIPENLQSGNKADEVQNAIDGLEQIESDLDNVDMTSVDFPGMF